MTKCLFCNNGFFDIDALRAHLRGGACKNFAAPTKGGLREDRETIDMIADAINANCDDDDSTNIARAVIRAVNARGEGTP